jgi:serine/threonine-protein phosphatase 6 regulatory ankyrin repeat subunit B
MFATEKGHLTTMQALLSAQGIDIDAKNNDGFNALMVAAANGKDEAAKALISKGANVNAKTNDGWTPLMFAAEKGHLTTIQILLSAKGINIDTKNSDGATALILAAANGKDDVVKALIDKGADVNVAKNYGWSPLMRAAEKGHLTTVQALLGVFGIDMNAQSIFGRTALYWAALYDKYDVVKALVDHGADINQLVEILEGVVRRLDDDSDGLDKSKIAARQSLLNYIAQHQADVGNLHEEATWASAFATSAIPPKASQKVIPSLEALALDTLIQQAQAKGPSLLQISFQANRDQLLQHKLSAAQVGDLIRLLHNSPFASALVQTLALAIKLGGYHKKSDLDLILEKLNVFGLFDAYKKSQSRLAPENINRWQVSGQTLLTRAAQAGDQLLVDALINCGAALHLPDQHGNNALHAAVKAGMWSVCGHLLALDANPNTSDRSGVSTLAYLDQAFTEGDEQTAAFVESLLAPLLAKGYRLDRVVIDPDDSEEETETTIPEILQSDMHGWTPLMLAAKEGDLTTVQTLLSAPGIDIDAKKLGGATALYVAAYHGKVDVVKALISNGANVNAADNNGWTVLMSAANQGHLTTVQVLLDEGVDIKQTNADGMTVLDIIAIKEPNEMNLKLLALLKQYQT